MVRDNMIPVHIDYGFADHISISNINPKSNKNITNIADILLSFLKKGVKVPDSEKGRKKELKDYLKTIKTTPATTELLEDIINNIRRITGTK